jgi:hypothetical protein
MNIKKITIYLNNNYIGGETVKNLIKLVSVIISVAILMSFAVIANAASPTSSTPHTIFVTFNGDAKTQRSFTWYTDADSLASQVQIGTKSDFSDAATVTGTASAPVTGGDRTNIATAAQVTAAGGDATALATLYHSYNYNITQYVHKALATGLTAGTKYYYRVGAASAWSDTGTFTTQAANATEFSFIDVTDTQGAVNNADYTTCWKPALDKAFKLVPDAAFVMDNGDLTNQGGDLVQWQAFADSAAANLMNTTFVPIAGNHESYVATTEDNAAGAFNLSAALGKFNETGSYQNSFINHFNLKLPSGETNTTAGAYYSFDYANAHFMILNTNFLNDDGTLSKEQVDWLKSESTNSTAKWKIVAFHRAVFSAGTHIAEPDIVALRAQLPSIIAADGIDIVLQGHDHTYMRTKPIDSTGKAVSYTSVTESYNGSLTTFAVNPAGTVYIIPGATNDKFYPVTYNAAPTAGSTVPGDVVSSKIFPDKYLPTLLGAQLNQLDAKVAGDIAATSPNNTKYNAPTFAGIKISGDKLLLTEYQYNIDKGTTATLDTYAIAKPATPTDVINQIAALPAAASLKFSDIAAINAAKKSFDALEGVSQALVTNSATLSTAVYTIPQLQTNDVIAQINTIGEIGSLTYADKARIAAIRKEYDSLTALQQADIYDYIILTNAEQTIADMTAPAAATPTGTSSAALFLSLALLAASGTVIVLKVHRSR